MSSRIILYHTLFTSSSGLLHQRGPLSDPLTSLHDNFSFQTLSRVRVYEFILMHLKSSALPGPFCRSSSVLNYLTCTPGSKALMHLTRPRVLCKLRCFNEGAMNNSGVVFHEQRTAGTNS